MNKNGLVGVLIVLFILIVGGIFIWGYVGGVEAHSPGVTCDMGIMDDALCFKWHKNFIGKVGDFFVGVSGG